MLRPTALQVVIKFVANESGQVLALAGQLSLELRPVLADDVVEEGGLEAVAQLAGRRLLEGIRGGPPVDLEAPDRIVRVVAELLCSDPAVAENDCNPVMVCNGIPIVADALAVLNDQAAISGSIAP